jgi:hypothetical protein
MLLRVFGPAGQFNVPPVYVQGITPSGIKTGRTHDGCGPISPAPPTFAMAIAFTVIGTDCFPNTLPKKVGLLVVTATL